MSNQTWRKYGGLNKMEKLNNITVNSFVTDKFTVREVANEFQVSALSVFGNANLLGTLSVAEQADFEGPVNFNSRIPGKGLTFLDGRINFAAPNAAGTYLVGTKKLAKDVSGPIGDAFMFGVNQLEPDATLDIQGAALKGIQIFADRSDNWNILAQNANPSIAQQNNQNILKNTGISLFTNYDESSILYYCGNNYGPSQATEKGLPQPADLSLKYTKVDTTFTIGGPTNTKINTNLLVSKFSTSPHISDETMAIYDVSAGLYLPEVYNTNACYGNALSLVATDNSSNTILNIIAPNQNGLNVKGGAYANDIERSMGIVDVSNVLYGTNVAPAQMVVSGKDKKKYPKTVGINTHTPQVDNYILDINGKTNLSNNDLKKLTTTTFEVFDVDCSKTNKNYAVMVGGPYTQTIPSEQYKTKYSNDGGITWNDSATIIDLSGTTHILETVYVKDASYSVIASKTGANMFFSKNSNQSYLRIKSPQDYYSFTSIYISPTNTVFMGLQDTQFTFGATTQDISGGILYFNFDFDTYISPTGDVSDNKISNINTISLDGHNNFVYALGHEKINKYEYVSDVEFNLQYSQALDTSYNKIRVFDETTAIAVGTNAIIFTKDGTNWTKKVLDGSLNDVTFKDANNALVIGENSKMYYSRDGFATWTHVEKNAINSNGMGFLLDNSMNLTSVYMPDDDRFIINTQESEYVENTSTGSTNIIHSFLPDLLNRPNNSVMDIYGNIDISGDLIVNNKGKLRTTNNSIDVFNETVDVINFGNEATTINIGGTSSNVILTGILDGSFNVDELVVLNDVSFNSDLVVGGDASFNSTLEVKPSGHLLINSDASFNSNVDFNNINIANNAIFNTAVNITGNIEQF